MHLFLILGVASIGGLLFGYNTGVIAGALPFIQKEFHLTQLDSQILVSSPLLGALISTICAVFLANSIGRRHMIGIAAFLFTLGALCSAIAPSFTFLLVARLIVGFGIGIASYAVPLYISEMSPQQNRGCLIALNTIAVTGGIVIAYLLNYWLSFTEDWRWMFGLGTFPALLLWLLIPFLPESLRWLIHTGRMESAQSLLLKLRSSTQEAYKEYVSIQKHPFKLYFSWADCNNPHLIGSLTLAFVLAALQQLTGINAILYYAPILLRKIGFPLLSSSLLITIAIGLANLTMTVVALFIVDKVGRRSLLLGGAGVMIAALALLGTLLNVSFFQPWMVGFSVLCLLGFVSAYAISIGCLFWILIAEIFPLSIRNAFMSLASSLNWLLNLLVSLTFLKMMDILTPSVTFWCYALIGLICWLYCYVKLPETSGYSLEEIEEW